MYEVLYNLLNMTMLYLLPLLAIIVCYSLITCKLYKKLRRRMSVHGSRNRGYTQQLTGPEPRGKGARGGN